MGRIIYKANTKYVPPLYIPLYFEGALICALSFLCYNLLVNIIEQLQQDNPISDHFLVSSDFGQVVIVNQDTTEYCYDISIAILDKFDFEVSGRMPIIDLIRKV